MAFILQNSDDVIFELKWITKVYNYNITNNITY